MKHRCHVDYSAFFLLLCTYLLSFPHASSGAFLNATPPVPLVGERCALLCQATEGEEAGQLHALRIVIYKPMERRRELQRISFDVRSNIISVGSKRWHSNASLQIKTDVATRFLKVSFTATPSDRTMYGCVEFNARNTSAEYLNLKVQQLPSVLDLSLRHPDRSPMTSPLPGDVVLFTCTANLGYPHSSELNISAPGEIVSEQNTTLHSPDAFGNRNVTAEVQRLVRTADNGENVTCSLANSRGTAERSEQVNVRSPVRSSAILRLWIITGGVIFCLIIAGLVVAVKLWV